MFHRRRVSSVARFAATVGLAIGCNTGFAADLTLTPAARPVVQGALASSSADLPPLPPRDPQAPPAAVRPGTSTRTTAVVEVVVGSGSPQPSQISSMGWTGATAPATDSGRSRIEQLDGEPAGRSTIAALSGVTTSEDASELRAAARTEVVAADGTNALLEFGVIQTEVVFEGVPVMSDDLAPFPTSFNDDLLTSDLVLQLALAPQPLALPVAETAPQLAPTPTSVDEPQPATGDNYAPPEKGQGDRSVDDLHKPLSTIGLTTGLSERKPPDLSGQLLPAGGEQMIWGAPWPETCHRCYRYSYPFTHRPLYFEQPNFERCGTSLGIFSPYASAATFAGHVVMLPLHMLLDPPCTCVRTLGDCGPCESYGLCPHCNLAE